MSESLENYKPTEEHLRLVAVIQDPRNVVTVNEAGERDLSFMKQEMIKPENAWWRRGAIPFRVSFFLR